MRRTLVMVLLMACARSGPPATAAAKTHAFERRAFMPMQAGKPLLAGVSYGPFRKGQRPGGPHPTAEQILEDLRLISARFGMIRVYGAGEPTGTILQTIASHDLPVRVMVGAWISADDAAANEREIARAIELAVAYPEEVIAVSVGNETQVSWSGHRSEQRALVEAIRRVRAAVSQPVTTADDYNFWNKPEAARVAAEVDFLCLHAYAMWNQQTLEDAVAWTAATYTAIADMHPELRVVMCESGWATELNPEGDEVQYIKAPAGEAEQAVFYEAYTTWAHDSGVPYFYFEAFDEPWKGSGDPREVEKHWGLYREDRTPKRAVE